MSWIAKTGDTSIKHILTDDFNNRAPYVSRCGVELDPSGMGDYNLEECSPCQASWDEEHPRRNAGRPGKLPRHKCPDPDCGAEHIIGRNVR